jgi:hypothetical protein
MIFRFCFAALCLAMAGCALDDPYDDMTPLEGTGEKPSVRNRFPDKRGGLPHSRADRADDEMTPLERLRQY